MSDNQLQAADLPVLPKEKMMRALTHFVLPGVVGVTAVNFFMPSINKALGLLVNGVWSLTELGLAAICATVLVTFAIAMWSPYKRFVESCANKATWAIFEWDPITPMELWIKEVRADGVAIEQSYQDTDGVIASNQEKVDELRRQSAQAQKLFAAAVKQYGEDSHQARLAAIDVGTPRETADQIEKSNLPLIGLRDVLLEVCQASEFSLHEAEAQVAGARTQWEVAQVNERASNAATRVLRGHSQRSQDAQKAMELVRNRFASSFGRVRAIRKLAERKINGVKLQEGVYLQDALEDLRGQAALLTGKAVSGQVIDIVATPVREPVRIGNLYGKK